MVSQLRRSLFESGGLGRYRLERRIGEGGFGEVWAARDRKLGRPVAVKILHGRARGSASDSAEVRFEREIRATVELVHPHTVRLFDHGVAEAGMRYYVMELLSGQNLEQLVGDEGPMRASRAVELARQASAALAEAHRRGIVHRDVKPQNLFVTPACGRRDFVKVLDFGLAIHASDVELTGDGLAAGSPSYIPPEVLRGQPADSRSDVYGLGAVLYFLMTGRPPFVGHDAREVLFAHLHRAPDPPSRHARHEVPPELDALVVRCLSKSPDDRPVDGADFFELLGVFMRAHATHVLSRSRISEPPLRPSLPTPVFEASAFPTPRTRILRLDEDGPTRPRDDDTVVTRDVINPHVA